MLGFIQCLFGLSGAVVARYWSLFSIVNQYFFGMKLSQDVVTIMMNPTNSD